MADIRIASPNGGGFTGVQGTRKGDLFVADWRDRLMLEGRVFMANVGAFSTPITGGGAGTILDLDQPELMISVPDGTTIRPLRVTAQCHVPLMATDADECEILLGADRTKVWDAAGASTAETALNMRTDNARSSVCTVQSAFTGDITTAPVLGIELAREVITGDVQSAVGTTWGELRMEYEPTNPPFIVGPAMLLLYWGGTVATPGFAQVVWAELPTTEITAHNATS